MIFSVIDYLKLHNAIYIIVYLIFYKQMLNWLSRHYRTSTTLLGKNNYINS